VVVNRLVTDQGVHLGEALEDVERPCHIRQYPDDETPVFPNWQNCKLNASSS